VSLETQIAALVSAANSLTSAVGSKISDINKAVSDAQKAFDEFTTTKFPSRVQAAQNVSFYIDPENGSDTNSGTTAAAALKTMAPLSSLTRGVDGVALFRNVDLYLRAGFEHVVTGACRASSRIRILGYDSPDSAPKTLTITQGFGSDGRPVSAFSAPFVQISEVNSYQRNTVIKTAKYPTGHSWPAASAQSADWIALSSAFVQYSNQLEKLKLIGVRVELCDAPLISQYMAGSMPDSAALQVILSRNVEFIKGAAGGGSGSIASLPYFISIYGNSLFPLDMISSGHVLTGFASFSEVFMNLSTQNVRSSHAIV